MKKIKQLLSLFLAASVLTAAGCGSGASSSSSTVSSSSAQEESVSSSGETSAAAPVDFQLPELPDVLALPEDAAQYAAQLQAMYEGTGEFSSLPTAEMETSMGIIKIRLFPAQAPKTVENFITHAKNGYYDGVTFHRVMEDFMAQGGDPEGTGMGGESIWGAPFEDEFSEYLHNFRGALSMANAGPNTNGSQFFIVQNATPVTGETREQMTTAIFGNRLDYAVTIGQGYMADAYAAGCTEEQINGFAEQYNEQLALMSSEEALGRFSEQLAPVMDIYAKTGGTPYLDSKHTVFGYVYEGMDVVDAIVKVEKQPSSDGNPPSAPKEPITIKKITIRE